MTGSDLELRIHEAMPLGAVPVKRLAAIATLLAGLTCSAALAQPLPFFRVQGPPTSPGGPPVQPLGGLGQSAVSGDEQTLVFFAPSGSNISGASGQQVMALALGTGQISLVSTTSDGAPAAAGSATSGLPAVSANARHVAFETTSSTYTGGVVGVHIVRIDRVTRQATPVNVTPGGSLPPGTISRLGGISADGNLVVFASNATNLVPGAANAGIYVRDIAAATTQRIDVGPGGVFANASAQTSDGTQPSISADGRFVAFQSSASNLLGTAISGSVRIYLRDRQLGTTTQASIGPGGADLSGSNNAAISADGSHVTFTSASTGATATQMWARRLSSPAAIPVPAAAGMGICSTARISNSGIVVAQCRAGNPGLPAQAYVWSLTQPGTAPALISGSDPGNTIPGNAASGNYVAIGPNARVIAFDSNASDLVPGDTNGSTDVFVYADPAILDTLLRDSFE